MGALVTLASKALEVVPGSVASCTVTVKNAGTVVDQFTIDVLGDPGAFASAAPPALSLFPGTEGSAVVSFAPPRASPTPTGALPFGIRARSEEDPADCRAAREQPGPGLPRRAGQAYHPSPVSGSRGTSPRLAEWATLHGIKDRWRPTRAG